MRVHGKASQAMDASHELAVRAWIVGGPAPALRRKEIAAAEFRTMVRRRLRHRAAEEATVAKSALTKSQPREVKLRIIAVGIVRRWERNKRKHRRCGKQRQNNRKFESHVRAADVLISAPSSRPRRIYMIQSPRADHFDTADFTVLDKESLRHENARGPIETSERVGTAVRENALIDRSLIKDGMRVDNAALLVHHGIAATVDALHDEVVTQLELRKPVQRESVDRTWRLARRPRNVGGG